MTSTPAPDPEQHRWLRWLHLLLAVTIAVPSVLVLLERPPGAPVTLLLAAGLGAWYALTFVRAQRDDGSIDVRLVTLYAVGAVALSTLLQLREPNFFLLLYAVMPQLFSSLPRWGAALGVAATVLLPAAIGPGIGRADVVNLVAAVGLGAVVTAIIEMLAERNEQQRAIIAELEAARAENERLAERAAVQGRTAGVLAERQRLAHDIHDTLAQGFTSIVTQLEAAEQALAADGGPAAAHVARAKRTAREGLAEARRTVEALRPAPLEGADLPAALRALAERWGDRETAGTLVDVVVDGTPVAVDDEVEAALLRVAQEALANVDHHARATRVTVTVTYLDDVVLLDVQDDGVGFDVGGARPVVGGFGLTSMRERVGLVGGALAVESTPGEGTTVAARVPLGVPEPRRTTPVVADGR